LVLDEMVYNPTRTDNMATRDKRKNNDPQNTTQKTEDRATRISQNIGGELM